MHGSIHMCLSTLRASVSFSLKSIDACAHAYLHTHTQTHTCCSDGWARYVEMSQVASLKATTASNRVSDDWDMMPTCQRDRKQPRLNANPNPKPC